MEQQYTSRNIQVDKKKECAGAIVKAGLSLPRSAMKSESSLSEKLDGWIADLREV